MYIIKLSQLQNPAPLSRLVVIQRVLLFLDMAVFMLNVSGVRFWGTKFFINQ
jgi:hypothetical protein